MKRLIERLVQMRNPQFAFDQRMDGLMVLQFFGQQCVAMLRGFRILLIGKNPKWMMRGSNVKFKHAHRIKYGKFLKLGNGVTLSGLGLMGLKIGHNVGLGSHSNIICSTSLNNMGKGIKIGDNVGIGEFAYLGGAGGLEIGNDCIIGQYFSCHPENHNYMKTDDLIRNQGVNRQGIKISENCWIGSNVTILDGVRIGAGSIVAAGAVVASSFPVNSVIAGVPAKIIKSR